MFLHTLGDAFGMNPYMESHCGGEVRALCSRRVCAFPRDTKERTRPRSCWHHSSLPPPASPLLGGSWEQRTESTTCYTVSNEEEEQPRQLCSKYLRYTCNRQEHGGGRKRRARPECVRLAKPEPRSMAKGQLKCVLTPKDAGSVWGVCCRQLIPRTSSWGQKDLIKSIFKYFKGCLGRNLNIFNSSCKKKKNQVVSLLLSYEEGTVTMGCIVHISLILQNGEHIGVTAFGPHWMYSSCSLLWSVWAWGRIAP